STATSTSSSAWRGRPSSYREPDAQLPRRPPGARARELPRPRRPRGRGHRRRPAPPGGGAAPPRPRPPPPGGAPPPPAAPPRPPHGNRDPSHLLRAGGGRCPAALGPPARGHDPVRAGPGDGAAPTVGRIGAPRPRLGGDPARGFGGRPAASLRRGVV